MTEMLVRISDVEFYLRRTAQNMLDEAEKDAETLSDGERGQICACVLALRELANNVHRLPAEDAVDVVRCKECKHRGTSYDCPFRHLIFTEAEGYHYEDVTTDDGYCSFGERKEVSHGVDGEKRADPSV